MFVSCECRLLSSRDVCDNLITHPESVLPTVVTVVCDLETSRMRRSWPTFGRSATGGGVGDILMKTLPWLLHYGIIMTRRL